MHFGKANLSSILHSNKVFFTGIILVVISLISAISSQIWNHGAVDVVWYVPKAKYANFGLDFLTFVILYNNLIPISLQVRRQN